MAWGTISVTRFARQRADRAHHANWWLRPVTEPQAAAGTRYTVRSRQITYNTRARRRANPTIAMRRPRRAASACTHQMQRIAGLALSPNHPGGLD